MSRTTLYAAARLFGGAVLLPAALLLPAAALLPAAVLLAAPSAAHAEPATRVYLNGVPTPVFFNDGDSFRVLAGPMQGSKARLAGFNTLESFGPVHSWGDFTARELYANAKMATLHARRGVWRCEGDMKKDTYGRTLWWCPDLALDLVRRGLAHAYSHNEQPARPELLAAQKEAMEARRGMWAHGVPPFVLTSIHSHDEGGGPDGKTYNRLISTVDGHSEKWQHEEIYEECRKVCHTYDAPDLDQLEAAAKRLRDDPTAAPRLAKLNDVDLLVLISRFVVTGKVVAELEELARLDVAGRLEALKAEGVIGRIEKSEGACMIHVDFRRRFGADKAACLK